jgi:hypothetical protein
MYVLYVLFVGAKMFSWSYIYIYIVSGYVLQFLDSIWVVVSQVG